MLRAGIATLLALPAVPPGKLKAKFELALVENIEQTNKIRIRLLVNFIVIP